MWRCKKYEKSSLMSDVNSETNVRCLVWRGDLSVRLAKAVVSGL